jgi:ribonuclease P protein component
MNNRILKSQILSGKRDFGYLFSSGSFLKGKFINAIYVDGASFKIGFAVSKRIKGAVKRNRVKRQLREIFRTNKSAFPENKWIVLIGKCEIGNFEALRNDVIRLVNSIK